MHTNTYNIYSSTEDDNTLYNLYKLIIDFSHETCYLYVFWGVDIESDDRFEKQHNRQFQGGFHREKMSAKWNCVLGYILIYFKKIYTLDLMVIST